MSTITLSEDKLYDLIDEAAHKAAQDTIVQLLTDKDALKNFLNTLEDMSLGKMMDQGRTEKIIDTDEFLAELDNRISK